MGAVVSDTKVQLRVDLELLRKVLSLPDYVELTGARTVVDSNGINSVVLFDIQGPEVEEHLGVIDAEYRTVWLGHPQMPYRRFAAFQPTDLVEAKGRLVTKGFEEDLEK